MQKLKNRLDAFSDGIMAVIITIMVLDISPVLHDSWPHYLSMSEHIGIYLITFVFVFNMWYQHSTVFAEIDTMTYLILIWDVVFLAFLSLMPLFTDMMAENTTRTTVILYGVMQAAINFVFRGLAKAIIHLQYTTKDEMQKVYQKIYGNANHWLDALSLAALIMAYFLPRIALLFYLAYPILSFLINADARQQMYDAEALPDDQQKDLAALPASAYVDWRKAAKQLRDQATQMAAPSQQPQSQANHDSQPESLPTGWADWLNQNIDPRQQRRRQSRYNHATAAQQQRMEQWFKTRRQQEHHHHK